MRYVGDEVRPLALHLFQRVGHRVKCLCQGADLVPPILVTGDTGIKFPLSKLPGGLRHFIQRPGLIRRKEGAGHHRDHQHDHSHKEENRHRILPHALYGGGIRRNQHHALNDGNRPPGQYKGDAHHITVLVKQAAQIGHACKFPLLQNLAGNRIGNSLVNRIIGISIAGVDHAALGV